MDADFKAIAGNAKKSPAFKAMAGGEPEGDEAVAVGGDDEDASLSAAFDAVKNNDVDTFKAEMAAAMRACYASESAASVKK